MEKIIISESFRGALYEDGMFKGILKPGRHEWDPPKTKWWGGKKDDEEVQRIVKLVDMRNRSLTLKGQEILTADKVAVRISILIHFCVTDVEAALHKVESYEDRIYEDVQLSARRFLSDKTLDEILKDRNEISDFVRNDVKESAASYGVEVTRADVKDLAFPGNLREIMNRVLETERQSEAMLIEAQKKADALRIESESKNEALKSRLDAERMLAEQATANPALLRLKELETLERIAAQPGNNFYLGMDGILGAKAGANPDGTPSR